MAKNELCNKKLLARDIGFLNEYRSVCCQKKKVMNIGFEKYISIIMIWKYRIINKNNRNIKNQRNYQQHKIIPS